MQKGRLATLNTELLVLDAQLDMMGRREADIQRVLDEMKKMQDAVVAEREALKAKRRELIGQRQPISWLPGEILIEIFSFICSSPYENESASIEDRSTLINVTHACSKWRTLALSTSRLWSLIHIPCTGWSKAHVSAFIARSSDAPLDVIFGGQGCFTRVEQCTPVTRRLTTVLAMLIDNISRLRYLSVDCMAVDTAAVIVQMLNDTDNQCPHLSSLSLAITREVAHPASFPNAQRPLTEFLNAKSRIGTLKHLRLQRIPFLSLSPLFYSSLKKLDISFANLPLPNTAPLKDFLALLSMSRQLVHLSLSISLLTNSMPVLPSNGSTEIRSVVLPCLKHIDLNCGHSVVFPRLFSYMNASALEKIELWLTPSSRTPVLSITPPGSESRRFSNHQNLHLSTLKDLSLQFIAQDQDLLSSSLRYFTFPVLRKLELVNTDPEIRSEADAEWEQRHANFPPIPRFESFFRDPRFPFLTHLSVSHFEVEESKVDALLGYIPALTSLSLDTAKNCLVLLESLALKATRVAPGQSPGWMSELVDSSNLNRQQSQRRMKFCPRLEALSFWGCDLNVTILYNMIKARNDPSEDDDDNTGPYTAVQDSITTSYKRPAVVLPARRVIKPLRRTKLSSQANSQQVESLGISEENLFLSSGVSSTSTPTVLASPALLQAMQANAAQPPARISYLRLAGCKGIDDSLSIGRLEKLVGDVVWSKY
ncbi:hypothetical protein J3R30DRAFT_324879 [Lentinula aciculospora]|uniref:F-box domain-containing protein n=1 Tax=Lentinula aciculospora TaxID=153920 RepID=A0A9W9DLZ7_9AGAR|nr:hypothetical protein J3R30DRAFT_324879 [Lentinula aciculospora]